MTTLFITTERCQTEPEFHARCEHAGKIYRATSTSGISSAAMNLAVRILVGPKAGFKGSQKVDLIEVACGAFEATLKLDTMP